MSPARKAQQSDDRASTRRAHDGDGVKQRIIDSATQILGKDGYGGLSVSAVCKHAEVSAPTLYWHFGSKEGLLAQVLKSALKRDADAFLSIDITKLSRAEAFEAYLKALRRVVISEQPNNWVILSALSEARNAAPEIPQIIAEARRRQVEFNAEQLSTLWGLKNEQIFVHLWLAYCNYASLLYQDTRNEELVEGAIQSFRSAYFLLVQALKEDGAAEAAAIMGLKPARTAQKPSTRKKSRR